MAQYIVFGLGKMGLAICYDLLRFDNNANVVGVDVNSERIQQSEDFLETYSDRFSTYDINITDENSKVFDLLDESIVAFGAIDYRFNELLSDMCIQTKTSFLDLGGNPDVVASQYELHNRAEDAGITIIPDCGLAPGMVNIIAAAEIRKFDEPDECHIRVGGLPQLPKTILRYQQVFSIRGLTNEYIEDAIVIRDREVKTIPSLSELESLTFPEPFGELEAFQTAGGTSSLPKIFEGKINELTYKTIRYPGHMQYFRFLQEFELLSEKTIPESDLTPRQVIEHYLQKNLPQDEVDVVLARIFVCGHIDGQYQKSQLDLIDYFDETLGITAMARTTAYPISIIGQMIANGKIESKGVQAGENVVPVDEFMTELSKRNIEFTTIE